jgi:hypothetical protein
MENWSPELFEVGAKVTNPQRPGWGAGEVLEAQGIEELRFGEDLTFRLHRRSPGQRLQVRFDDGRTRTVITASTRLKAASNDPARDDV